MDWKKRLILNDEKKNNIFEMDFQLYIVTYEKVPKKIHIITS